MDGTLMLLKHIFILIKTNLINYTAILGAGVSNVKFLGWEEPSTDSFPAHIFVTFSV